MAELAARLWVGPREPFVAPLGENGVRQLNPEDPGSLFYTRIIEGNLGPAPVSNWRELVDRAVRTSSDKGVPFGVIEQISGAKDQDPGEGNFRQIEGTKLWVRGMDANQCWQRSFRLAQRANTPIKALVEWENKEGAAHPGERAILQWSPPAADSSPTLSI